MFKYELMEVFIRKLAETVAQLRNGCTTWSCSEWLPM